MIIKNSGETLPGFLVYQFLSMIILFFLFQSFIQRKDLQSHQNAISEIQENSRIISALLKQAIHQIGTAWYFDQKINFPEIIYEKIKMRGCGVSANPIKYHQHHLRKQSDHFLICNLSEKEASFISMSNNRVIIDRKIKFKKNDIGIIYENNFQDFFYVNGLSDDTGDQQEIIILNKLSKVYGIGAKIRKLNFNHYYVADSGRRESDGKKIYSLYGPGGEMVEHVENLKIKYGIFDFEKKIIQGYYSAEKIESFENVVALELEFLLSSSENVLFKPINYRFNQNLIQSKDRRIYQAWVDYAAFGSKL